MHSTARLDDWDSPTPVDALASLSMIGLRVCECEESGLHALVLVDPAAWDEHMVPGGVDEELGLEYGHCRHCSSTLSRAVVIHGVTK